MLLLAREASRMATRDDNYGTTARAVGAGASTTVAR